MSDHDFLIVIQSNFLCGMHSFLDNEVLLQARDVHETLKSRETETRLRQLKTQIETKQDVYPKIPRPRHSDTSSIRGYRGKFKR